MAPSRAARHAEIACRYDGEARARKAEKAAERRVHLAPFRVPEIARLLADRYGGPLLPDDDAGREDARIMADHLAFLTGDQRRNIIVCLRQRAPWMDQDELNRLIEKVVAKPLRYSAETLGKRFNLTRDERTRLKITTIRAAGQTTAEIEADRKSRERAAKLTKARKKGAKPRDVYEANSISRTKPWEAEGISRRTWYRRQAS